MSERICSIDDCDRKHYAKGMCRPHYSAAQYAADPDRFKARNKASYERTREKTLARQKAYAAANRPKVAAKVRAWRAKNRDAANERARELYAENATKMRERKRIWREAHAEEVRQRAREIAAANPERVALKNHRRRQRITDGADLTADQWSAICSEYEGRCAYCAGEVPKPEFEHVVPLSRGGRHTASNVVPACRFCNRSKGSSTAEEFVARKDLEGNHLHGRLSEALRQFSGTSPCRDQLEFRHDQGGARDQQLRA